MMHPPMFSRQTILAILILLWTGTVSGQAVPVIRSFVNKNRILLGEPFELTVEASFTAGAAVSFPQTDTLPPFERVQDPTTDSTIANGLVTIRAVYRLTSFDSGHWVIPSFHLSKKIKSDTLGIDVVFSEFDPGQDYHDIKDIIEVKADEKDPWWWYAAGGVLLLAMALIYFLRKKKPVMAVQPAVSVDPFREAMNELDKLLHSKPDNKQYHTRLAGIFRLYVYRRKGILSLQKTTDDLVLQLKDRGLTREEFDNLCQSLRLGDMVKFARYSPTDDDDRKAYQVIRDSIKSLEKTEDMVPPEKRES